MQQVYGCFLNLLKLRVEQEVKYDVQSQRTIYYQFFNYL